MTIWARLYDFVAGTRISSSQVDDEFNQVIGALNQHTTDITNAQTNAINFTKGYGLGDVAKDISSTNLNSLDVTGFYQGSSLTNYPPQLLIGQGSVINIKINSITRRQIYFPSDLNRTFERYQQSNTWQPWVEYLTTDTSFTPLTLTGTSVNAGRTPRYMQIGKQMILQGEITYVAAGTVIATLPALLRPSYSLTFVTSQATGTNGNTTIITVSPSGAITVQGSSSSSYAITLNGISFIAEQ